MLAISIICALVTLTYASGNIHVTVHITQPQDQPKVERIAVVWKEVPGKEGGSNFCIELDCYEAHISELMTI
ncbi:hypothetical protein DdX_17939 [Ditylenchus destructor]|uniref:Uncharacterized protein n=1 Tax=Ditylenchus destructor TaxID=166010 RepID=A0AAD4QYQ8_9BILA|nr:hypothetical protein DdX_17939 [Ditylenchus destructor]